MAEPGWLGERVRFRRNLGNASLALASVFSLGFLVWLDWPLTAMSGRDLVVICCLLFSAVAFTWVTIRAWSAPGAGENASEQARVGVASAAAVGVLLSILLGLAASSWIHAHEGG